MLQNMLEYKLVPMLLGYRVDPIRHHCYTHYQQYIFVNASIEDHEGRYTFTIAHEIGHHVLHKELYDELISDRSQILCREEKKKPLIEQQADRFAACLMMPRRMLVDEVERYGKPMPRTLSDTLRLANHLNQKCGFQNVSISALVNRLKDLGLVHPSIPYQTGTRWRSATSWNPASYILRRLKRWLS